MSRKKILLTGHYREQFKNEHCFKTRNSLVHENCFDRFIQLRKSFLGQGIELIASDEMASADFSAVIVHDIPSDINFRNRIYRSGLPLYLIAEDVPFILPDNFSRQTHEKFRLVFTWFDEVVDGKKVIKHLSLFPDADLARQVRLIDTPFEKKSRICMVATNHILGGEISNYQLRRDLADWYRMNDSAELDIYGRYWDRTHFSSFGPLFGKLNHKIFDPLFSHNRYGTMYKGLVKSKYFELTNYKYQFVVENCKNINGFLSEKLFDCLVSRLVPVYFCSGESRYIPIIPSDLYINGLDFESIEELAAFLKYLPVSAGQDYLDRAEKFLDNLPEMLKPSYASDVLVKHVVSDLADL